MWKGCIILVCALLSPLIVSWYVLDWSDEDADRYPGGVLIYDDAGNLLRVTLGEGDIDSRPTYEADPEDWIVKALIAAEDGEFYSHNGVRFASIARAFAQNILANRRVSGASTITMQTVRLISPHPKGYWWKYREMVYALKMERRKDKRWILSQYLNRASFGSNLVGIEAASQGWFGKSAKSLGIGEAALLAGIVQAPSRLRPDRHPDRALKRREYVLRRMRELDFINDEQLSSAEAVELSLARSPRPFAAPHFCDWVIRMGENPQTDLNADIQHYAELALTDVRHFSSSVVVLDVKTGSVKAMALSDDYFDPNGGQVNTAVSRRSAGSTLKPFLTALAMDRGIVTPSTLISDEPIAYRGYRPQNFDGAYRGEVSVRDSLILSLNIPFVKILDRVGVDDFTDVLRELGFSSVSGDDGLGLAIGNAEVSLLELTMAYRMLAIEGGGVFSPEASYLVYEMLSGSERSAAAFGHIVDSRSLPRFAWKTGTSSGNRDAWAVLWNPEYVIGVWCGYKDGRGGDLSGAFVAAPIAWKVARALYPQATAPEFTASSDVRAMADAKKSFIETRGRLRFLRPEEGAVFERAYAFERQKIVFRLAGVYPNERIWWFVNGIPAGSTYGNEAFASVLRDGKSTITATTSTGEAISQTITVFAPER